MRCAWMLVIVDFQQDDLAFAAPQDQAGPLAVGVAGESVSDDGRASPRVLLEVQAGASAVASFEDPQFFHRRNSIRRHVPDRRVIQEPPDYGGFVGRNGTIHDSSVARFPA